MTEGAPATTLGYYLTPDFPQFKMIKLFPLIAGVCGLFATVGVRGAEIPLHDAIDRIIETSAGETTIAPPAGDAEFARRVYLDLAGRIPTIEETRRFLAETSPNKRQALIDRLLGGPDYPRRMQELFHAMLMERRGDNDQWTAFLRTAFRENMSWDRLARSIIHPDAENEATRGAAYFFTARLVSEGAMAAVDVPGLTRDVGRLLAGVDLGCAQCHDHVSIDDYKQVDFQGLHMIFENVKTRRDVKFPAIAENLMTEEKEFMSVFIQLPKKTPPRVPGGDVIPIATFAEGEEYEVPPDRKTRSPGVPKFSPLGELAAKLTSADNELFCRNITNRLWFVMMGRGLVEPLDLQHKDNPPTHPELLDLLAREFAGHNFDIKWLLSELALTDCYQRTSERSGEPPAWKTYALANEKRMSAEQLFWSALIATGELERIRATPEAGIEQLVADAEHLSELQKLFLKTFANPPKEPEVDFEPTVKAALFLMHDERLLALLQPREGNLTDRLSKLKDASDLANELFLSVVSRPPSEQDIADVEAFLADKKEERRNEAIGHLVWALLASTEFCVNH